MRLVHANDAAANQFLCNDLVTTLGGSVLEPSNWLVALLAIPLLVWLVLPRKPEQPGPRR